MGAGNVQAGTVGQDDPNGWSMGAVGAGDQKEGAKPPMQVAADPYVGQQMGGTSLGPIQQPQGWDFSGPGVGEQFFNQNQQRFMSPGQGASWWQDQGGQYGQSGAGENYWNKVQGKFNTPTASESYFKDFEQNMPEFGAYYDRAKERTAGSMNSQLAARGNYGSSAGVDMMGQAFTDLDAKRANRESDYMLNQARLGGQLAGQSDSQRMAQLGLGGQMANAAQGMELNRLGQAGQMALGVDASDLARLQSGMSSAMGAQDARRTRGRDYMSDMFNPAQALSGIVGPGLQSILQGDMAMLEQVISAGLGLAQGNLNQTYRAGDKRREDMGMVLDAAGTIAQAIP